MFVQSSFPFYSAFTDINGLYELAMWNGTYDITFEKSEYYDYTAYDIIAITGDTIALDVTLYAIQEPCTSCVRGLVENRESAQIESVYVWAVGTGVDDYTDFIGRYSLEELSEGTYDISFSHPYYLDTTITDILVSSGSGTTLDLLLEGNGAIAGVVVDSTFQPIAGVTISVSNLDLSSLTDSIGGYFIDRIIPEHTFDVFFTHDLYFGEMLNNVLVGVHDTSFLDTVVMSHGNYEVIVWYGNPDGSPITVPIGGTIFVDVYVQSADYLNLNFLHLPLGTDDQYIVDHHSAILGVLYYPLTEWDDVQFLPPDELSPGWQSQSLLGFADLWGDPNPYLQCIVPTRIASFALEIVNDTSLIGDTVSCFMEGYNPANGGPLFGDSTGIDPYFPVQFFSPLCFREPLSTEIWVWYGNPDSTSISAPIGDTILVDVFVQSEDSISLAFLHLPLGTDDQYIVDHHSVSEGVLYYPLTEWDEVNFLAPVELSPGWQSQSLLGFADLWGDPNPYLLCLVPTRIASFALEIVNDTSLIGDTVSCFMEGYHPANGEPLFGDPTGTIPYYPIQFFSSLYLAEPIAGCQYVPGDVNSSGNYNGLDITFSVIYFKGGQAPYFECECTPGDIWYVSGDVNGSCYFNGIDVTYGVAYFKGGPDPISCPDCQPVAIH